MNKRRKFKAHGANPLKQYRRRFTDLQVMIRAEIARQARLRDRQPAELAFEQMLRDLGLRDGDDYVREKIYQNGDRWILVDFQVGNIAFEIDGSQHNLQVPYDTGRTQWLVERGVRTVRFTNIEVLKKPETIIQKLKEILNL